MIEFAGYEHIIQTVYQHHQEHIFAFWADMTGPQKKSLLEQVSGINFELIASLYAQSSKPAGTPLTYGPSPYIALPRSDEQRKRFQSARAAGIDFITKGRVAAFVVAGGQGSRLGFKGPKGKFRIGPISDKSLFQIHAEKITAYARKYHVRIPLLVMTSIANHDETAAFFRENNFFGLDQNDVFFFPQSMVPSLDMAGKLILETPDRIFTNPDGHGGSLSALRHSGVMDILNKRGIELISYFQVDNPLVNIIDPVFIGFHLLERAEASCKGLRKVHPGEKIGVFVTYANGRTGIIEYSDLTEADKEARDEQGEYRYIMGNPAIHLFGLDFLDRITAGAGLSLPYHTARKKIKSYTPGGSVEIDGFKFEKFVFDALTLAERCAIVETPREDDFAPVKNPVGEDSVESCHKLMSDQCRRWLIERGIAIPQGIKTIEISPLVAVGADDLPGDLVMPDEERVYLG